VDSQPTILPKAMENVFNVDHGIIDYFPDGNGQST